MHRAILVACAFLPLGLSGCQSAPIEGQAPGDVWRWDRLVRVYQVTLLEAYDAARALAEESGWEVDEADSSSKRAHLDAETRAGVGVCFELRTISPGSTEIGIDAGNKLEAIRVFRQLEEFLSGASVDR